MLSVSYETLKRKIALQRDQDKVLKEKGYECLVLPYIPFPPSYCKVRINNYGTVCLLQ